MSEEAVGTIQETTGTEITETVNWKDGVEKSLRFSSDGNDRLSRFDDAAVMATSYLRYENSQNDRVKIPTNESSADERSSFYKKTGRPDTSDGYTLPQLSEGQEINRDIFKEWAVVAHESGMSDKQFSSLAEKYVTLEIQRQESELVEFNRFREESDRKLHEKYGADYDVNIELSKRAYTEYAGDDLKELLETDKFVSLKNEPAFIDMMVNIAKKQMDDTFVAGDGEMVVKDKDFVPNSPSSPEMYALGNDEYSQQAREYFKAKGHVYG